MTETIQIFSLVDSNQLPNGGETDAWRVQHSHGRPFPKGMYCKSTWKYSHLAHLNMGHPDPDLFAWTTFSQPDSFPESTLCPLSIDGLDGSLYLCVNPMVPQPQGSTKLSGCLIIWPHWFGPTDCGSLDFYLSSLIKTKGLKRCIWDHLNHSLQGTLLPSRQGLKDVCLLIFPGNVSTPSRQTNPTCSLLRSIQVFLKVPTEELSDTSSELNIPATLKVSEASSQTCHC